MNKNRISKALTGAFFIANSPGVTAEKNAAPRV
nr:MAG TPA: hypothetical protein [Bacteriophage sp.]